MENSDNKTAGSGEILPLITPRHSLVGEKEAEAPKETPHASLVHLAKVVNRPVTPPQGANTSAAPVSQRGSVRRTPGAGRLAPLPSKRTARSPHIVRAFEQRRAGTPGRERRKSGRYPAARETPRDLLRALSRQLATTSERFVPTPTAPTPPPPPPPRSGRRASSVVFYNELSHAFNDDEEDELPPPRLSMNLNDLDRIEDEEDIRIPVPRFSVPLDDIDTTSHSIEFGRRAVSERPYRPSFGIRLSDRFADFNGLGNDSPDRREESRFENDDDDDINAEGVVLDDGNNTEAMSFVNDWTGGDVTGQMEGNMDENIDIEGDEPSFFLPVPDFGDEDGLMSGEVEEDLDTDVVLPLGASKSVRKSAPMTKRKKKPPLLSKHGIPYQPLPRQVIKKMASKLSGSTISNDTLDAIAAATNAFFRQVSDDLSVYAKHAGRRTIEDSDVIQLLQRQRQINSQTTVFSLAQRHLPRELLQEIRMPTAKKPPRARRPRLGLQAVSEDQEDKEGEEESTVEFRE